MLHEEVLSQTLEAVAIETLPPFHEAWQLKHSQAKLSTSP